MWYEVPIYNLSRRLTKLDSDVEILKMANLVSCQQWIYPCVYRSQ